MGLGNSQKKNMASVGKESKEEITKLLLEQFETCPICCEPFGEHILQCKNSHLHCESCASKLARHGVFTLLGRCSSCREPVDGRNRQGEEIRAKFTVTCKHRGCGKAYKLGEAKQHTEICLHAPFECGEDATEGLSRWVGGAKLKEKCSERLAPAELEEHLMEVHEFKRHAAAQPGTWMFSYEPKRLEQGHSEAVVLLDKDAVDAELCLWMYLEVTSHRGHPKLVVVPCSTWRDDKRRVRILMHVIDREFEFVHTMRVWPWDKRWSGLDHGPAVKTNWAFESHRWTVKFVVCTDPYLDDEFPVLNPMLKEAKDNPRKKHKRKRSCDEKDLVFLPEYVAVGDQIDARDCKGKWYASVVKEVRGRRAFVHFNAWPNEFDEWMCCSEENMAALHSKTEQNPVASITPPGSPVRQQLSQ